MAHALVALDFTSEQTVKLAVDLTVHKITLMHVLQHSLTAHAEANAPDDLIKRIHRSEEQDANFQLEAMALHIPEDRRGELLLRRGSPAEVIVKEAENYDMVIVSTKGRTGIQHMLLGSVAEKVVRLASKPVLVVR